MSKILLLEFSGTTYAHYFNLESIDKGLLAGRKYVLVSACFLPALSLVYAQIASAVSVVFMVTGMTALCVGEIYNAKPEKEQRDRVIVNLTHKVIAYCFPLGSGIALTAQLSGSVSIIAALVAGMGVSILLGVMMYDPIGRDWNNDNLNIGKK